MLRALGPFDSAVVFEGEHALLGLCRALDEGRPLRGLPNVVHRDALVGAKWAPGEGAEDLRALPAPDFDGLPLDLYLSPSLTLPYDPTRGCYWGKCTFCHYGLAEIGTASYRERGVERAVDHLSALADKYGTRWFYLSQDSVAPKTLLKLAQEISRRGLDLKWATDLKPEKYLTAERARALREGGGVACALGVESANPRVLALIDKGAPVSTVRDTIDHLAAAGLAVEAMCFTDFPTETYAEAMDTLRFLEAQRDEVALYIVGEFDLTHGALVAQEPERFGIRETWQLDGDLLGTGLFYEEARASKRGGDGRKLDAALDRLSAGWRLKRYPWAGSLSTAHSVLHYAKFGPGVFRRARPPAAAGALRGPRRRGAGALRSRPGRAQRRRRAGHLAPAGARAASRLAGGVPGAGQGAATAGAAAAPLQVRGRAAAGPRARGAARAPSAERGQRRRLTRAMGRMSC